MRLLQLRYFVDVASSENISSSARKLRVAQPSLSKTLKQLEQELGVTLFIRNGHSLKLSSQGTVFSKQVTQVLNQLDDAVNAVKTISSANNNAVTLRFETSSPMIPTLIQTIKAQVPGVTVNLVQHGLENNRLEHYDFEFSTHPISGNTNKLLTDEEIYVAVSSHSKLSRREHLTPDDLLNENLILSEKSPLRTYLESYLLDHNFKTVIPKFVTSDRDTFHGLTAQDIGYGFVPERSWLTVDLSAISLHKLYPDSPHRKIYLSFQPSMDLNPVHVKVERAIEAYFEKL